MKHIKVVHKGSLKESLKKAAAENVRRHASRHARHRVLWPTKAAINKTAYWAYDIRAVV